MRQFCAEKNENDLRGEPTPPTPDRRCYQNIQMLKYKKRKGVFPLNKEIIGINIHSAKLRTWVNLTSRLKKEGCSNSSIEDEAAHHKNRQHPAL